MREINRRAFVGTASTASLAVSAAGVVAAAQEFNDTLDKRPVRAAVLEFADRWSDGATGAAELLRRAGCTVVALDWQRSPIEQQTLLDLIVFGSFTNNGDAYKKYVNSYRKALQLFVERGWRHSGDDAIRPIRRAS